METETKQLIKGGVFIIKDTRPEDIFTPEDFSEEQIMMKESVQEFIDREVWPRPSTPVPLNSLNKKVSATSLE